ncbi:MAG: NAD-dependent epimerase/dehydratase family protein, partial [Planctomycetota bacterium]|nr:NAD-dependent epimerase/dehydratase family protein [Planctomycetota bacterium]
MPPAAGPNDPSDDAPKPRKPKAPAPARKGRRGKGPAGKGPVGKPRPAKPVPAKPVPVKPAAAQPAKPVPAKPTPAKPAPAAGSPGAARGGAPVKDSLIGQMVGRCRIEELIGLGRTARVYRATYEALDQVVAIKILRTEIAENPILVERFMAEAKAIAKVDNENVLKIYDVGMTEGGLYYMVVELLEGDVGDAAFLDGVFEGRGIELVVHCAGRAVVAESVREPDRYFAVNTVAGHVLLEAMRRHGATKIVCSSTCSVYGLPESLPVTERTPTRPVTPYGSSKLAFEQMLQGYARAYGFKALSLRYFNVGGAATEGDLGDLNASGTRLIPNLIKAARSRRVFSVFGHNYPTRDGTGERDFIHVEDLARAHAQAVA